MKVPFPAVILDKFIVFIDELSNNIFLPKLLVILVELYISNVVNMEEAYNVSVIILFVFILFVENVLIVTVELTVKKSVTIEELFNT
jgi:hypothetical protein